MKKRLLLLRHAGHTAANHRQFLGSTNLSLAEYGRFEAASISPLIKAHKPERCICSPLKRCIETIELISQPRYEINSDLREIDFGHWEGMTFGQIQQTDPTAVDRWANFDPDFSFPGGERIADFLGRVRNAAEALASGSEKTVLAVTHGGVMRALICHFLGLQPRQYVLFNIEFASLTILDLFGGKGVLAGLNQRCHMENS